MTVILIFVLIFQAMTLAGVISIMEEREKKAQRTEKKMDNTQITEEEARRILDKLANDMAIWPEETAAIDMALAHSWCYLDGPCEYDNAEIKFPEEEVKAYSEEALRDYIENGQTHKRKEGAKNGQV